MKKPEKLPEKYAACFSDFVTVAKRHKLILDRIVIAIDHERESLDFSFETPNILTVSQVFSDFLSKYPTCTVDFTNREVTPLEQMGHLLTRFNRPYVIVK